MTVQPSMAHLRLHDGRDVEPFRHQAQVRRPSQRSGISPIAPPSLCDRRPRRRALRVVIVPATPATAARLRA